MSDVIELLESIGQDAALRYASADELVRALELAGASEACTSAIVSGDKLQLYAELGQSPAPHCHHQTQGSAFEDQPDGFGEQPEKLPEQPPGQSSPVPDR